MITKLLKWFFGVVLGELSTIRTDMTLIKNKQCAILDELVLMDEVLNTMANREAELNQAITDLSATTGQGFQQLNDAVASATDRVIKALQKKDINLDDEINALTEMKGTVASGVAATVGQLNSILPADVEPIPVPEPPQPEEPTEPTEEPVEPSEETPEEPTEPSDEDDLDDFD